MTEVTETASRCLLTSVGMVRRTLLLMCSLRTPPGVVCHYETSISIEYWDTQCLRPFRSCNEFSLHESILSRTNGADAIKRNRTFTQLFIRFQHTA